MKRLSGRILSILLAITVLGTCADKTTFAAAPEEEDSVILMDEAAGEPEESVLISEYDDEEIPALGSGTDENSEKVIYSSADGQIIYHGEDKRVLENIDLQCVDYVKIDIDIWGYYENYDTGRWFSVKDYKIRLVDSNTNKSITEISQTNYEKSDHVTIYLRRNDNEIWNYTNASIWASLKGYWNLKYVRLRITKVTLGEKKYSFRIATDYNDLGEYRERIYTGEDKYENGMLVEYPKPYFTDGNGKHVEEMAFDKGQTVSASVWEGGGTNSQGVKADSDNVKFRGFKLAKPGAANELSDYITSSKSPESFTFDNSFLSKYKSYASADRTFTLVPIYEPKEQTVEFLNDYGSVDGVSDVKGVYDGFETGYSLKATKLDTIQVSAKAKQNYKISYIEIQRPNGAMVIKAKKKYWTRWATINSSADTDNKAQLLSRINCRGQMYTKADYTSWGVRDYGRVLICYDDAPAGSITMAPSPQSVNEGADGKLTFIKGPGAENDPNFNNTVPAGTSFTINNTHLYKPYIFSATSKSGFHAYWADGTLDTDGDGADDIRIPGYEPFRNTFGDQFKFIPQVSAKNKVYYNFVKDVNVDKEVKSLPLKGQLLLKDRLLISGKTVQKGLPDITVFASGFKAGQEVKTDENGNYELASTDRFKYYDLYNYNVTFTGDSEAGTIGVVYSQNPGKLGNVIVDAAADVDINDVKLLTEQDKKDGSGKEYVTVDTSDAKFDSSGGYFALPGGDRNYRLLINAHRKSEVLAKGVLTFTNTDNTKVAIIGTEDAAHSGLFTFDFNPKAKGIGGGATARVAFTGNEEYLSRDVGIKVSDSVGRLRILNTLTSSGLGTPKALGSSDIRGEIISSAEDDIVLDWNGEFDDITDNLSTAYMDGSDRVISVGFGRKIFSSGGEKDLLMNLARFAATAQEDVGEAAGHVAELKKQIAAAADADKAALQEKLLEAEYELLYIKEVADKAQDSLDERIETIQRQYRQQAEFDDGLPVDLGYSLLMTFGYDDENGQWYFKDMLCTASVDADSDMSTDYDMGLGLATGVSKHLRANGRATFVVEQRQDITEEERKEKRYYITEDNKENFDILSVAGSGEDRRLDSYGRLHLDPEITLTGFSNLAGDLVQVDVDGKADYDLVYGALGDVPGACALNASVKIRMMNYTDTIPLLNGVYNVAETDSLGDDPESSFLSRGIDTLETEDLSFLEGEDNWYGEGDGETWEFAAVDEGDLTSYSEDKLANRIATDAGYHVVSLGDGKFAAVFLNAEQERIRDRENSKAAFYTYYDGNKWSGPMLLEDDGTLDLYPHIYKLEGGGAIALWSSVSEDFKDNDDKIERVNALDLHGRLINADGTLGDGILEITESTDNAADRVIGITQNGEKLVIVYEKRFYEASGKEATIGDMLYAKSCRIVYRTYDLTAGEWGSECTYDGYLQGAGMLLDSDMSTYTAAGKLTGALAYTVDTDQNLNSLHDRELYLSTYDFDTNSFAEPVLLTGDTLNSEAAGTENSSPKFVSTTDALYLLWLQGGNIVSMNVQDQLQNGKSSVNAATLVSDSTGAITAFSAETDGSDIYVIWPQASADESENTNDGLKDIQMWGVRAETADGAINPATSPVQITSSSGERYDDVAFGVYDGVVYGMASKVPSRIITESEAREVFAESFDEATFVPYAIWDDTGASPVAFRIGKSGIAKIENAGFTSAAAGDTASFSLEIHNYSFRDLSGVKVTAEDKDGNSCILQRYVPSETEGTQGEVVAASEITIDDLRGGDSYIVTGTVPLSEEAGSAEVTIGLTLSDGTPEDYATITKELTSDITMQDISISDYGVRGFYKVTGRVVNEGSARSDAGVINLVVLTNLQEKNLRQIEYPALLPGESYELDEKNEDAAYDDNEKRVLIEVSDDDFMSSGLPEGDESVVREELHLYAGYKGGTSSEYRIAVTDSQKNFITREIPADRLEELSYVTGVQVDAIKAAADEEGYPTGELVSSGKSVITLEAGEAVDIQAEILTNSPRKGAQASVDEEGKIIQTSTGTEGLSYHYEYIGDNAEINTDGMLSALEKGSGRLRVYVYPDTSEYVADNNTGDTIVEINGEQFRAMDDEDSYGEDAFHKLPAAAIKTFVLDVNIIEAGEREGMADPLAVNGIRYRRFNDTSVVVCGLEAGKTLNNLTIPATVTIDGKKYNVTLIDAYAFNQDANIKEVTIGKNVTSIGSGAFEGCENIKKLALGSGLTQIGESAFKGCTKIAAITLPSKLERIEAEAFYGCASVKSLVIPSSVTYIGDRAFYGCEGLKKITIKSEKLTGDNLGRDVFLGVPQSAEYEIKIKDEALKNELTDKLTDTSQQLTDKKGIVYQISSKADRTLAVACLSTAAKSKLKTVSIPTRVTYKGAKYTVTAIGDGAFADNTKLNKVTIPKTVTAIGERAFEDATALKSVTIPAQVMTLGAEAFSGCVKLSKVTIAAPNLTVGEDAFKGVPDTAVFKYAFKGDEAVFNLRIQLLSQSPSFVSKTGLKYEILDPKLTGAVLTGAADKNIKNLTVPDTVSFRGVKLSVISVKDGAFAYHKNLKKVVLGKNVIEIRPDAFAGCSRLTSVNMKGVLNIYFSAFKGCTSLKKITVPKTVSEIGNEAFEGCSSLKTILIQSETPTNLEFVGADAFENICVDATFKISAKKSEDKQTIKRLLTESGVDPTRIK